MPTSDLKLIATGPLPDLAAGGARSLALVLGLGILACALAATGLGADQARREIDIREPAEQALRTALARGSEDVEVRDTLVALRRTLGWRPLESRTRVVYASLLLGLSTRLEEMQLAGFHARRAAELAPVTVSVVRAAALVLAHTGALETALALVRQMFGYDPARAAETLAQIDSSVLGVPLEQAIPDAADAWLAWSDRLRAGGRSDAAEAWLERTHNRWPAHVPASIQIGARAFLRGDWPALETLLPPDRELPATREAAPLHVWRAHLRRRLGDARGALADAERAVALGGTPGVRRSAGDLFLDFGDLDRARREWSRALHEAAPGAVAERQALLARLARLEDRHGQPAKALRYWEELLRIDPADSEARRRADDLSGFRR